MCKTLFKWELTLCMSFCLSVSLAHLSSAGSVCLSLFHYLPASLSLSQSVSLALSLCLWLAQLFWGQSKDFAGQGQRELDVDVNSAVRQA